ncbi:MAG: tRNA (adenosine(37)-N6)-threonylcarbamoyltransferase complex dimerization subunit type 1 TsaB [Sphaerochaetaceae bacterium]|nr:tRNA (adenosine(37)-N6)-threonylcarbamoyltransferase complex dimerization subunit type 1 TsaB [Sphaerochaetaceae bacterium]
MNILVTDTSTQALTVALKTESFFETRTAEGRGIQHSERLMPIVLELCADAGISTKDIDLLGCTRGPGSFTGLRIGMAAFKGMAYALDKPLVSVSTLETIARCVPYYEGAIVSVIDAKKQRWYLGAFESTADGFKRIMPDTDGTEADLVEVLKDYDKVLVTGPDAKAFAEPLKALFSDKTIVVDTISYKAISTALLSEVQTKYEMDGADDIGQGPVYLRKSDAEVALEERLKEKANG